MSMTPPPIDYSGGAPGYSRRPSGVTPIAVIGIIFGALGILCMGCTGLGVVIQLNNPDFAQRHVLTHGQIVQQLFVTVVGLALSILLLSASIGALNLAAWARKGLITFAVLELIFDAYRCFYVLTRGLNQAGSRLQNPTLPPNATTQQVQGAQFVKVYATGFRTGMIAVTIVMFAFWLAYCIWILIVMRRADVIAAFEGGTPPGTPPGYPPSYPPTYPPQQQY